MKRLGLVVALALAGCAAAQNELKDVFSGYEGRPIESIIARWGPPESVLRQSTGTIYVFNSTMQSASATPATTTGMIGSTPVIATTNVPTSDTLSCREQVHTDTAGRIVYIGGQGNDGACTAMLRRLK